MAVHCKTVSINEYRHLVSNLVASIKASESMLFILFYIKARPLIVALYQALCVFDW